MNGWRGQQYQLPRDESERIGPVSQSAWCNINDKETNQKFQIGHSFNGDDEDREHFTKTRTVNVPTGDSYGRRTFQERQEITETLDMCGYHSRKQAGLFSSAEEPEAIEASAIEEAETESAQSESEMWRAKYEAELARRARFTVGDEVSQN